MILPEELVFEILLRLPVRSLLRFRCVCKEWCAMIKSCRFKDKHLALRNAKADSMGDDVLVFKKTSVGDVPNRIYKAFASCCNGDYESLALSVSAAASAANDYFEILEKSGNSPSPTLDFHATYNVTTELFQEIHLPHGWNDYGYIFDFRLYLFERSDLALVGFKVIPQCDGNNFLTKPLVDIWVMKEYGVTESWTKQYSVTSLSEIGVPLPFRGKDKLFITMLDGELICYDLSKGEVYQPLNHSVYLRRVDVIACIESLVSVK